MQSAPDLYTLQQLPACCAVSRQSDVLAVMDECIAVHTILRSALHRAMVRAVDFRILDCKKSTCKETSVVKAELQFVSGREAPMCWLWLGCVSTPCQRCPRM